MSRRLALFVFVLAAWTAAAAPIEESMKSVERIRGLTFLHPVHSVTIQRAKLPLYLRHAIETSMTYSFDDYMLILKALRLVDPATAGGEEKMLDLLQQQILAFYDPVSHTYYDPDAPPSGLPASAQTMGLTDVVAVHELTHALQDQRFDIGKNDAALRTDSDASLAFHSVVEGEATLVMLVKMVEPFGQTIDSIVKSEALAGMLAGSAKMMSAGKDVPPYFVESLAIPYTAGLRFVMEAYRHGGWERVSQIYSAPPQSMREVLHPEEYLAGHRTASSFSFEPPIAVGQLLSVEHLGEWHWQFLLGEAASRGWMGDRVTIAQDRRCDPTVLVETLWESPQRARAFGRAYDDFLMRKGIQRVEVRTYGNHIDVAYGADDVLIQRFIDRPVMP